MKRALLDFDTIPLFSSSFPCPLLFSYFLPLQTFYVTGLLLKKKDVMTRLQGLTPLLWSGSQNSPLRLIV